MPVSQSDSRATLSRDVAHALLCALGEKIIRENMALGARS